MGERGRVSEKVSARKRNKVRERGRRGEGEEKNRARERARERERERGRKCVSERETDLLEQNVQANVGDESFTT